jgi:hypothetical protein
MEGIRYRQTSPNDRGKRDVHGRECLTSQIEAEKAGEASPSPRIYY